MYNQLLWEEVYFRGKLVIEASHWARYLEGTLVNMKYVVVNFVTRSGTIHGGLKPSHTILAWKRGYILNRLYSLLYVNISSPNCNNSFTLTLHTLLAGNCDHVTQSMKTRLNSKCAFFFVSCFNISLQK